MLDFVKDKNKKDARRAYFVDKKSGKTSCCSLRRMRLMRQHNLAKIFEGIPIYRYLYCHERDSYRRGVYSLYNFVDYRCVPYFSHPHDVWVQKRGEKCDFVGTVVAVAEDRRLSLPKNYHLLIEIEPNVFAFACTYEKYQVGQKVTFYFYKYNSKTKKIYGAV